MIPVGVARIVVFRRLLTDVVEAARGCLLGAVIGKLTLVIFHRARVRQG